jgi:predicted RNase H-like nuclease (RuvC/YqgF family)
MASSSATNDPGPSLDDDRSPVARLRRAELRAAHLEGQVETLQAQVAALEAADEHRRTELAAANAETAEAQAVAREAQARAEERGHLIDELRNKLSEAQRVEALDDGGDGGKAVGWRTRRRANRS